jgi:CreA protein
VPAILRAINCYWPSQDFFGDPSQASLTCTANGPVLLKTPSEMGGTEGKEIFSESKGFNIFQNKALRVRRIYDAKNSTILYITYSTRLTSTNVSAPCCLLVHWR